MIRACHCHSLVRRVSCSSKWLRCDDDFKFVGLRVFCMCAVAATTANSVPALVYTQEMCTHHVPTHELGFSACCLASMASMAVLDAANWNRTAQGNGPNTAATVAVDAHE